MTEDLTKPAVPNSRERVDTEQGRSAEEWRTDSQTDMDRIWYASEFRRLEGVTQVVPPQDEYVFHDRLTHSMKVAQVAATLARMLHHRAATKGSALRKQLAKAGLNLSDWVDADHCYAAGLAHDIGHPPFGHAGEHALQVLHPMDSSLNTRSFEGNAQSTRIVSTLSFRKPKQKGLNLTLRTLAAIAKYPWLHNGHPYEVTKLYKKWSFYPEEAGIHDRLERGGFIDTILEPSSNRRDAPLRVKKVYRWPEAEIMDWADDISYAVHDIEDFFRAGRIPLHRIASALKRASQPSHSMFTDDEKSGRRASQDWLSTNFDFIEDDEEIQDALIFARTKMSKQRDQEGKEIGHLIPQAFLAIDQQLLHRMPTNKFNGSELSYTSLQNFGSAAITYLSETTTAAVIEVSGRYRVAFRVDPVAQLVAEFFKAICQYFVISTSVLSTMQHGQELSLTRLARNLKELAVEWGKAGWDQDMRTLPARLREYLLRASAATGGNITEEKIDIAIVDYLCGLRDIQATILDARLFGDRSSLSISGTWLDA
jgi:dGTPase